MNESRRYFLLNSFKVLDLVLLVFSFGLATIVIVHTTERISLAHFLSIRVKLSNCAIFGLTLLFWHGIFSQFGLYESKRLSTTVAETMDVLKALTLSIAVLLGIARLFPIVMVTPRFVILFWLISSVLLPVFRVGVRYVLARIRERGRNLRYILILGTNSRALEFARLIQSRPELGYRNLGFVDDDWQKLGEFKNAGFKLACDCAGLTDFLRRNVVDEVAVYLPLRSFYTYARQAAALCEQHGILLRIDSDVFGLQTVRSGGRIGSHHYVVGPAGLGELWGATVKRCLDLIGSFLLLVLLSPLFAVAALLIRLTSTGPIFFRQERVGFNKRKFTIYKFRTMIPAAEKMMAELEDLNEAGGPVFKIKDDPRITPIGKWLRRTSVDELPQLMNVLKGEMSLVGPRPLPVRDYEGFSEDWQRRRFSVRPGLTCLWQVSGRSLITFEQWMKLDLQYIDEWSLWLDLKILLLTIPAVLKGSGAV